MYLKFLLHFWSYNNSPKITVYTADQQLIIISIQIKKGFNCRNFWAISEPIVRSVVFFLRFPLCKVCFLVWGIGTMPLPHLRESKALLDSGFHV